MSDTGTTTTVDPNQPLSDLPPSGGANVSVAYPSPIGVPKWYTDPATGQVAQDASGNPVPWFGTKQVPFAKDLFGGYANDNGDTLYYGAQYNDGDEWAVIGNMPVELRAQVQQAMLDRGLFGSKHPNVALGSWDNESATAFKQVLAYANSTGKDWQDALQEMPVLDQNTLDAQNGVQRNSYKISLSNPQDLEAVFKRAAADLIGGSDVPQDVVDDFVRAYQQQERTAQEAEIARQEAASRSTTPVTPGTDVMGASLPDDATAAMANVQKTTPGGSPVTEVTSAPSAQTVAEQTIKDKFAGRYGATQIAHQLDNLASILGTGMGGGGSTQGSVV